MFRDLASKVVLLRFKIKETLYYNIKLSTMFITKYIKMH